MRLPLSVAPAFDAAADGYGLAAGDATVSDTNRLDRIHAVTVTDWRPDNWDPDMKVLTPDIDDDFFRERPRCLVAGCWTEGAVRTGICVGCTAKFRKSPIDDPTVWAAAQPAKTRCRRLSGECCTVTAGARRCPRPGEGSHNICNLHNTQWTDRRRTGMTYDEFLSWAKPLTDLGHCRAVACHLGASIVSTQLCSIHQNRWRNAGIPTHGPAFDAWAETVRAPAGWVIVLSGLSEPVLAEMIYAIQQREREQIKTDPIHISKFVVWLREHPATTLSAVNPDDFDTRGGFGHTRFARFAVDRVRLVEATIEEERLRDRWDMRVFGKPKRGRVDFRVIPIPWLRTAAKQWAEACLVSLRVVGSFVETPPATDSRAFRVQGVVR